MIKSLFKILNNHYLKNKPFINILLIKMKLRFYLSIFYVSIFILFNSTTQTEISVFDSLDTLSNLL